tara:strand:+ start:674 stop:1162 length:489 start_codon:yes stop_codon:yes gene_type:complete
MHIKKNNNNKTKNYTQGLRPFSTVVPMELKKILRKSGYNFTNIVDNWHKIVGREVSENCYPISIKSNKKMNNGQITLNVMHGKELEVEYKKKFIIDKINSFFGYNCISDIKSKIIQKNYSKKKTVNNLRSSSKLDKKVEDLNDLSLKQSLSKLLKAYDEKNN